MISFVNDVLASLVGTVLILVIIVHQKLRLSLIQNNAIKPLMSSHRFCQVFIRHAIPSQFLVKYPPQETSKEILRAQEDLMEAIQAFLKEYDHIPPNKKCMALLLAKERFLKIKQIMEEEQNQHEVMQELLLKLMNDLQILRQSTKRRKETSSFKVFFHIGNDSMIDDEEARDNFLKDVCTFLRKFSRIPFGLTPKVILIAWESFGKIKDALTNEQYQQEDIQELMSKILEDVKPKAITPDLPIEEPDNSLIMGDEYLDTIPSVEELVPIPSKFEGIFEDTCDVPVCEDPSTFDALHDHSEILSDPNDDGTSSDDDDFEDIEYVSLEEVNDVDQEEKEFDLEDILQIQDVILREKLLNINRLIANIESLNDNSTPNCVLKSTSPFPIPVTDSDSSFEKSDTSLSHSDNSLPEFETFSYHTEETSSGSTTTHANNSLPEYDSFHFEIEPDQGELTNVVMEDILGEPRVHVPNVLPTHPTLMMDSDFIIRTFLPFFTPMHHDDKQLFDALNKDDCPNFEDSRIHGFVHSYIRASWFCPSITRASNPQLHLGNPIS
ncbi:hypothetical protein Tco_1048001 [Tanacetum coccineum]